MVKMSLFGICKLITDSSLAYGGFHQLASMLDFKYHLVRLKLMHSVCHHQVVQNSRLLCYSRMVKGEGQNMCNVRQPC